MVLKEFRKPDLNAPRFRPKKLNILNQDFYHKFLRENPKYRYLSYDKVKRIVTTMNGMIYQTVIDKRDGVELPEQLGYIFIGTCPRKVSDNPDMVKSQMYGHMIQNKNWESDQYVAKIFYTNFETKYRFAFHEMWGFQGVRDFKRTVAKTYPTEWKKYVMVDNLQKVSKLFRTHRYKEFKKKETINQLEFYDEFDFT
jgi:hypothetical protein